MSQFEAQGERPIWKEIYDHLPTTPGEVLTYEVIVRETGLDKERARVHVFRAIRELERRHQRTARCIPNVGYEIVEAKEHAPLAVRQLKLSRRRVRRAVQILEATNIEDLSDPNESKKLESVAERSRNLLTAFSRGSRS